MTPRPWRLGPGDETQRTSHRILTALSTIALFAPACGSPIDPAEEGFGDSASYSAEESGTGMSDRDVGVGMLDPGECIADAKAGVFGYKFSIDRMQLQVAGDLRVTNGVDVDVITNARLELYSQAFGSISGGGRAPLVHAVEAGAAQFVFVGQSAGEWVTIPVLTSTPIIAHEHGGAWSLDAFSLAFVDDGGGVWTMTVGASEWL